MCVCCHLRIFGVVLPWPFPDTITQISVMSGSQLYICDTWVEAFASELCGCSTSAVRWFGKAVRCAVPRTTLPGTTRMEKTRGHYMLVEQWAKSIGKHAVDVCCCAHAACFRPFQTRSSTCVEPWQKTWKERYAVFPLYWVWLKPTFGGIFTH